MKGLIFVVLICFIAMVGLLSVVVPRADRRAQTASHERTVYLQKMGWDKDGRP